MKNYTCQTCGIGVLLEPAEVEEHGAYCTEHLFSEQFPELDRLADQVSDTEKQPGDLRQDTNRTASTETPDRSSVMSKSTPQDHSSQALTSLVTELLGADASKIIPALTPMKADIVRNRIAGRADWTLSEVFHLADMLGVTPSRFVTAVTAVADRGAEIRSTARSLADASRLEDAA